MRTARAALTFSLLLCAGWLFAGQYSEVSERLNGADNAQQVIEIVRGSEVSDDPTINDILGDTQKSQEERARDLRAAIELRAMTEGSSASTAKVSTSELKKIKDSSLYRDPGVDESSNWLSRALDRLKGYKAPETKPMDAGFLAVLGPILQVVMWALIAAVLCALVYFAVRHIQWRQNLERKATALLEDSEPERTLDEWLEQADRLEAEGKYREAVRALYLACLLRFDEALIARFDRGQTNWEHLARIEKSPKLPEGLDFLTPTKLFDRVWYGHQVRGREDSQQFRAWYVEITETLRRKAA